MAEIQQTLPPTFQVRLIRDDSEFIRASLDAIEEHLILGGIFAALVVYLFLRNFRSTIIAAIAIPTSIIGAFALMAALGFTLNQMTMLALTLMVGIVIDDAIVVLENIYRFIEEKGMSPFQAAIEGTREIGLAVMATTLSLLAVFLPVGFMGGIVGRFMSSFGLTSAAAIAISLLVSFTLTPMLAARWITRRRSNHEPYEVVAQRASTAISIASTRGCSSGRWRTGGRSSSRAPSWSSSTVPAVQGVGRELRARRGRVAVPGVRAPAGGLEPGGDAVAARSDCARPAREASGCVRHAGDQRRSAGAAGRRIRARSSRGWCRSANAAQSAGRW